MILSLGNLLNGPIHRKMNVDRRQPPEMEREPLEMESKPLEMESEYCQPLEMASKRQPLEMRSEPVEMQCIP